MYNNDSYYEAPMDDQAEHDELDEQVYDLVKHDPQFDPAALGNLGEAIQQDCNDQELQDFVRDCVQNKDWTKLGLKLYQTSWDYQSTCAEWHLIK